MRACKTTKPVHLTLTRLVYNLRDCLHACLGPSTANLHDSLKAQFIPHLLHRTLRICVLEIFTAFLSQSSMHHVLPFHGAWCLLTSFPCHPHQPHTGYQVGPIDHGWLLSQRYLSPKHLSPDNRLMFGLQMGATPVHQYVPGVRIHAGRSVRHTLAHEMHGCHAVTMDECPQF